MNDAVEAKAKAKQGASTNPDYAEFLPAAMEIASVSPPRVVPLLIFTIVGAVAVALVWGSFSWLDVYTNAAGRVRSTIPAAVVQPDEPGRIATILVENGKHVNPGETLLTLDEVAVSTTLEAALAGRASWLAEAERRGAAFKAALAGEQAAPAVFYSQTISQSVIARENRALDSDFKTLQSTLSAKRSEQEGEEARKQRFIAVQAVKLKLLDILSERVQMQEKLQDSGAGSRAALLAMKDQRLRVEAEIADTTAQLVEIDASIRNLEELRAQTVASFVSEQTKGIQAAERQIEQLDQEIRKQQDRKKHLALRAPISGTVQQLAITSVGQIVNPGQPLLVLVPDNSDLVVEALVPSSEIGFVAVNDDVVVKADSFPFTRYGTFTGKVTKLSEDAVTVRDAEGLQNPTAVASGQAGQQPNGIPTVNGLFYIARIELKSFELTSNGHAIQLEPGMTVRAEIKTESRRVIDYLLSPVSQVLNEAGHEK